jgi:hypothetical protein
MPALICSICIGNLSIATMAAAKTISETDNEPVIESIVEPTMDLTIEPTNESVNVEGARPKADSQSYRRRTWDGSSHDIPGRREAPSKRTLDDLEVVSRPANMESNRPSLDNDYNFWHDERFPIVQTWREKVQNISKKASVAGYKSSIEAGVCGK